MRRFLVIPLVTASVIASAIGDTGVAVASHPPRVKFTFRKNGAPDADRAVVLNTSNGPKPMGTTDSSGQLAFDVLGQFASGAKAVEVKVCEGADGTIHVIGPDGKLPDECRKDRKLLAIVIHDNTRSVQIDFEKAVATAERGGSALSNPLVDAGVGIPVLAVVVKVASGGSNGNTTTTSVTTTPPAVPATTPSVPITRDGNYSAHMVRTNDTCAAKGFAFVAAYDSTVTISQNGTMLIDRDPNFERSASGAISGNNGLWSGGANVFGHPAQWSYNATFASAQPGISTLNQTFTFNDLACSGQFQADNLAMR